ncbi:hypothetical protein Tcan_15724 [Toxocara canis]|uniref:Protein inscuteable homologue C-terminal domain-containing protein n=1 Tax=Toxocara canis TaxID=6265 RepID=A0A0B2VN40_TOXCA|nr:hypothetical protein Tcan_15724 [Toxocara canis]
MVFSGHANERLFAWERCSGATNDSLKRSHREWLSELAIAGEPECMSVLYAKSLLDPKELFLNNSSGPQRIFVGMRHSMKSTPVVCEAPAKPLRCIARMTSSGRSHVMTASTPSDDLCRQLTTDAKVGSPRRTARSQRPASSILSGEVVLRAHAAFNRYTNVRQQSAQNSERAPSQAYFNTATLPARRSSNQNNLNALHFNGNVASSSKPKCCGSTSLASASNCIECAQMHSRCNYVATWSHSGNSSHNCCRQLIGCADMSLSSEPCHGSSSGRIGVWNESASKQPICTCHLRQSHRENHTRSMFNIAISGETPRVATCLPSLSLSPKSIVCDGAASNVTPAPDGLECSNGGLRNDGGEAHGIFPSRALPPTHQCNNMQWRPNEHNAHCTGHMHLSESQSKASSTANLERISESDSTSSRTLSNDTLCCSESNNDKQIVNQSVTANRSAHFDSAVTIRVPSPNASLHSQSLSASYTQGVSNQKSVPLLSPTVSSEDGLSIRRAPPSYSQLRIIHKGDRTTSQVMLNQSPLLVRETRHQTVAFANVRRSRCPMASGGPTTSVAASSASPKSLDSGSNSSVDSGQGSGELSSQSHSSKDLSEGGPSYASYARNNLPSYARVASSMDHVLRTSSAINSLLNSSSDVNTSRELITKAHVFIQIIEGSRCARFLPDIALVKQLISNLQAEHNSTGHPIVVSSYFAFMLRKLVEGVLMIFSRIISQYLGDCMNKDRLLVIALEHLIHLMLFGDEICLEVVQSGGLDAILSFIGMPTTPNDTLRLLLRALAVICGTSKGAIKLLALGGLDTVIHILCTCSVACAVEAAGVLTQLTNPRHALVKLDASFAHVVARLLDVIDQCSTAESLLLSAAALANVSMQHQALVDNLYQHNATARLIIALKRPGCDTIFVQEQLAAIFSCLAAKGYEEALIAQGAVVILLSMLTISDPTHMQYCRRIRYKAAVCLGTIASKGIGLKALHKNNGYAVMSKAIRKEEVPSSPTAMICAGIKEKLERKYQMESSV